LAALCQSNANESANLGRPKVLLLRVAEAPVGNDVVGANRFPAAERFNPSIPKNCNWPPANARAHILHPALTSDVLVSFNVRISDAVHLQVFAQHSAREGLHCPGIGGGAQCIAQPEQECLPLPVFAMRFLQTLASGD